jgi:NAD(P)-dependent dehydrogenase (short-subunit alcohol dehydrogenase family)
VGGAINPAASIQVTHPSPSRLNSAPNKAAIVALTRALGWRVATDGIPGNCGATGPVWTPLRTSRGQPDEKIPAFGSETPINRPGQLLEMSPLYVLLASQQSSYVTGEVYDATGGLEIS